MTRIDVDKLREIAEVEFASVVQETIIPGINELRIIFSDGSFLDVWYSLKLVNRYSYHWERRAIDGTIYRHDNAPHKRWQYVKSFPRHFHDGDEMNVVESHISQNPQEALREILTFAREKIR
ncbi:MAG: hypothetical protein B6I38_11480 [Anaerolineaceae bacterium 4572_5.1]|nr:MAG: hypothetical protein B6I38_11480 [Anaerolineaceae bacterium 4572_5.1]RLD06203.1 MAG: hypothetical protein DRI56_08430 [Chloroflexota bacterium]